MGDIMIDSDIEYTVHRSSIDPSHLLLALTTLEQVVGPVASSQQWLIVIEWLNKPLIVLALNG
jgi:hypothetical protein